MDGCRLCNGKKISIIKKGTRDRLDIDVLRCNECGLVFLSQIETDQKFYTDRQMRRGIDFEQWRENTYVDDNRRFLKYREKIKGKTILDFGCGNGGFLKLAAGNGNVKKTAGIELDAESISRLRAAGLECYNNLSELPDVKFDMVFMFHVIEHLPDPERILQLLFQYVPDTEGEIVIETPNADDALLSIYQCADFANFTYWSPHIFLYNENTLTRMIENAGFKVVDFLQEQRYPLANHLRWLARGLPGGGIEEFEELNDEKLNQVYTEVLRKQKVCDTLVCTVRRG